MMTQEQANHYRGTIIDLATMIEVNIDRFFIDFFLDKNDKVRSPFFMELFINVLTFGQKIDKFNKIVTSYSENDEERCKHIKSSLQEFRMLRNNLAHRNGYINEEGNFFLFAYSKDDIELTEQQLEHSIEHWTVFAYEIESFTSNLNSWIFEG